MFVFFFPPFQAWLLARLEQLQKQLLQFVKTFQELNDIRFSLFRRFGSSSETGVSSVKRKITDLKNCALRKELAFFKNVFFAV